MKTGEEQWRKKPHRKGLATHFGPESCAEFREELGEALTGDRTGRALSREIYIIPSADIFVLMEGNTGAAATARWFWARRGLRPRARTNTLRTGIGRSRRRPWEMEPRSALAIPREQSSDER